MIVSQPGALRKILVDSLQGLPVSVIGVASGGLSAASMLKGRQPELLILDASLPVEETLALIEYVRGKYPRMSCLALAETSRERARLEAGGADFTVLSFDLPRELPAVIAEMQVQSGAALGGEE